MAADAQRLPSSHPPVGDLDRYEVDDHPAVAVEEVVATKEHCADVAGQQQVALGFEARSHRMAEAVDRQRRAAVVGAAVRGVEGAHSIVHVKALYVAAAAAAVDADVAVVDDQEGCRWEVSAYKRHQDDHRGVQEDRVVAAPCWVPFEPCRFLKQVASLLEAVECGL